MHRHPLRLLSAAALLLVLLLGWAWVPPARGISITLRWYPAAVFTIRLDVDDPGVLRPGSTLHGNTAVGFDCSSTTFDCLLLDDAISNCTLPSVGLVQPYLVEVLDQLPPLNPTDIYIGKRPFRPA